MTHWLKEWPSHSNPRPGKGLVRFNNNGYKALDKSNNIIFNRLFFPQEISLSNLDSGRSWDNSWSSRPFRLLAATGLKSVTPTVPLWIAFKNALRLVYKARLHTQSCHFCTQKHLTRQESRLCWFSSKP